MFFTGNLFIGDKRLIHKVYKGKYAYLIDEDNIEYLESKFIDRVYIKCQECETCFKPKSGVNYHKDTRICLSCARSKERNNFYGRKHNQKTKDTIGRKNKGQLAGDKNPSKRPEVIEKIKTAQKKIIDECLKNNTDVPWIKKGKDNGFYGKKHSQNVIDKIRKTRKENFDRLSEKEKQDRLENARLKGQQAQKELKEKDLEKYLEIRRKAGRTAAALPAKYKINNLEKRVQAELEKLQIDMEFCVILGFNQYDFGNSEHRILLEVHGDYWHGNPELFGDEANLRPLNNIQIGKQLKDKVKQQFAVDHGFKYFVIWENDVNQNNFEVLEQIHYIINNKNLESIYDNQTNED